MDHAFSHALWIGGPPCSGKTSVALLLSGRHDLRAYNSDLHTWEHHDKALERGFAEAGFWQSATTDEAWLSGLDSIVEHTLQANTERCQLMLEDIERLPLSPLTIAEGTPLFPWLVADRIASRDHAVWLVPTDDFQRARLAERPQASFQRTSNPTQALENRIRRELAVGDLIERDARARSFHVIRVDGSKSICEVASHVEDVFSNAIKAGPQATTFEARHELRRQHNLQIYSQVSTYFARVPGAGDPDESPVPFGCECGTSGCLGDLRATLNEARETFTHDGGRLLAAGHGS